LTKNIETGYFPEAPEKHTFPQLLGVEHQGEFYRLQVETFHLYQRSFPMQNPQEHLHDVFHIVLYREADNLFQFDGKTVESRPGTLVLSSPGIPHSFAPLKQQITIYHEITFSLTASQKRLVISFEELFKKYYGTSIKFSGNCLQLNHAFANALENCYFELDQTLQEYDSIRPAPLYQALEHLFEALLRDVFTESTALHLEENLQAARKHLEQKLCNKLSLKKLASIAGLSPEYFCRKFKKKYGESPFQTRSRLRAEAAMKLLKYSDHPMKQIAEELGYSDEYHFSKEFKKYAGIPPGKFKSTDK
jgi:AraC-like DNA-binding protein